MTKENLTSAENNKIAGQKREHSLNVDFSGKKIENVVHSLYISAMGFML
jgi:hypothetical protein